MAIVPKYTTYDLLDDWREYTLEDKWHFNQILGSGAINSEKPVYVQPDRDVVGRSIWEAVQKMQRYLHFPVVPTWQYDDITLGRGYIEAQRINLNFGKVLEVGQRATTVIEAGATVTYSSSGNSGASVDDVATITVTDATTDLDEIQVFFQTSDGANSAASENYRIVPVTITRSGSTVTIVGHRADFIAPDGLWAKPYADPNYNSPNNGTTTDDTIIVSEVDVYRVYSDSDNAVIFVGSSPDCSSNCDEQTCTGCAQIWDYELGIVEVKRTNTCCTHPTRLRIHYKAGWPLMNGRIDPMIGIPLFRYTNTLMPRRPCAIANKFYDVWASDRVVPDTGVLPQFVKNPFGIRNGQIEAWKFVIDFALGQGGSLSGRTQLGQYVP